MITEGFSLYYLLALVLILAAWMARKPVGAIFKSYVAESALPNNLLAERLFGAKPIPTHKYCPNCAEPMPISVLICDACDYNFLSGRVGTKLKSLPAPNL